MTDRNPKRLNPVEACSAEKKRYDSCFKEWYKAKFLKVSTSPNLPSYILPWKGTRRLPQARVPACDSEFDHVLKNGFLTSDSLRTFGSILQGETETSTECDERFEDLQVCILKVLYKARSPEGEKR